MRLNPQLSTQASLSSVKTPPVASVVVFASFFLFPVWVCFLVPLSTPKEAVRPNSWGQPTRPPPYPPTHPSTPGGGGGALCPLSCGRTAKQAVPSRDALPGRQHPSAARGVWQAWAGQMGRGTEGIGVSFRAPARGWGGGLHLLLQQLDLVFAFGDLVHDLIRRIRAVGLLQLLEHFLQLLKFVGLRTEGRVRVPWRQECRDLHTAGTDNRTCSCA